MEAQLIVLFVITFGAVSKAATETGLSGGRFPVDLHDPEVIQAKEFLLKLHASDFYKKDNLDILEDNLDILETKAMKQVVAGDIIFLDYNRILYGEIITKCRADIFIDLHNKMHLVYMRFPRCQSH
ncbi:uncharacterized protein LOC128987941 isoform X2 [Macrosteles quadrilineatus]|uniref:uncharacterized protein LOC128987941 isoform X2 n=1 Tax=Macrosteles quadrilineatus TaxID=74068 RepID=UPI0023E1690D|nr:uncharacterized protein LOC128987941 isoform X2 [Macrosteles quadrilineatus]